MVPSPGLVDLHSGHCGQHRGCEQIPARGRGMNVTGSGTQSDQQSGFADIATIRSRGYLECCEAVRVDGVELCAHSRHGRVQGLRNRDQVRGWRIVTYRHKLSLVGCGTKGDQDPRKIGGISL